MTVLWLRVALDRMQKLHGDLQSVPVTLLAAGAEYETDQISLTGCHDPLRLQAIAKSEYRPTAPHSSPQMSAPGDTSPPPDKRSPGDPGECDPAAPGKMETPGQTGA